MYSNLDSAAHYVEKKWRELQREQERVEREKRYYQQAQKQMATMLSYYSPDTIYGWDTGTVTTTATSITAGTNGNYYVVNPTDWNNMQYAVAPMVQTEAPKDTKKENLKNLIAYYYHR